MGKLEDGKREGYNEQVLVDRRENSSALELLVANPQPKEPVSFEQIELCFMTTYPVLKQQKPMRDRRSQHFYSGRNSSKGPISLASRKSKTKPFVRFQNSKQGTDIRLRILYMICALIALLILQGFVALLWRPEALPAYQSSVVPVISGVILTFSGFIIGRDSAKLKKN